MLNTRRSSYCRSFAPRPAMPGSASLFHTQTRHRYLSRALHHQVHPWKCDVLRPAAAQAAAKEAGRQTNTRVDRRSSEHTRLRCLLHRRSSQMLVVREPLLSATGFGQEVSVFGYRVLKYPSTCQTSSACIVTCIRNRFACGCTRTPDADMYRMFTPV